MIVDDRFLTVGSANLTNRSMGLDSELHVTWEHEGEDGWLVDAIRNVRVSLLAEHAGLSAADAAGLKAIEGLVARLDALAGRDGARLQRHGAPTATQEAAMQLVDPDDLPFDPETTAADEAAGRLDPSDEHSGRGRLPISRRRSVASARLSSLGCSRATSGACDADHGGDVSDVADVGSLGICHRLAHYIGAV